MLHATSSINRRGRALLCFECGRHSTLGLCGLLLLLLPTLASGQDLTIGGSLSKAQVEELRKQAAAGNKAQKALDALAAREVRLDVGVFFPFRFGNANQLWLWSDESVCTRIDVPAAQKFALWGTVAGGDKAPGLHQFEGKPEAWGFLVGAKVGTTQLTVISNGEGGGPPIVLDRLTIIVGQPKPPDPPPPPPDDALTKSLRDALAKDTAAGKGNKAHVTLLASLYRAAAADVPTITAAQLLSKLQAASAAMGIPPVAQTLTALRNAVADELDKRLPTEDRQLTLEDKNRIVATFNTIADVLEVLAK